MNDINPCSMDLLLFLDKNLKPIPVPSVPWTNYGGLFLSKELGIWLFIIDSVLIVWY